jgi:hypothetical protein
MIHLISNLPFQSPDRVHSLHGWMRTGIVASFLFAVAVFPSLTPEHPRSPPLTYMRGQGPTLAVPPPFDPTNLCVSFISFCAVSLIYTVYPTHLQNTHAARPELPIHATGLCGLLHDRRPARMHLRLDARRVMGTIQNDIMVRTCF